MVVEPSASSPPTLAPSGGDGIVGGMKTALAIFARYEVRSRKPRVKPKVIAAEPWQRPQPKFKRLEWSVLKF
jgi:hypothetical protein